MPVKVPIKVLLADDSDVMRSAIAKLLSAEPTIELVAQAATFAETVNLCAATNPDVLLIDLHMPDERHNPPELFKSQLPRHAQNILAMSVWIDDKTQALARSFGAGHLLDKTRLFAELLPAIELCFAATAAANNIAANNIAATATANNIAATALEMPPQPAPAKCKQASAGSED